MKRCKAKGCTTRFQAPGFIVWCSPECGASIAQDRLAKKRAKEAKEDRQATKAKREKLKSRADWLKDAERAVNDYVQKRDKGIPCVSCGCALQEIGHASHYRSVGSSPALRFDLANIHRSCVRCNLHLHGNLIPYRVELVKRIGLAEVERLEGPQPVMKYTIDELKAIKAKYRAMAKELE